MQLKACFSLVEARAKRHTSADATTPLQAHITAAKFLNNIVVAHVRRGGAVMPHMARFHREVLTTRGVEVPTPLGAEFAAYITCAPKKRRRPAAT